MATWLLVGLVYLGLGGVFLVAWSLGLPQPENSSRAIKRFERRRIVQSILAHAFQAQDRSDRKFISLLKKLDAPARKARDGQETRSGAACAELLRLDRFQVVAALSRHPRLDRVSRRRHAEGRPHLYRGEDRT